MQAITIIILIAAIVLGLTCCCKSPQMNLMGMGVRVSCVSVKLVAALVILIASVMLVAKRNAEAFATTSVDPTCKAGYYLNKATGGCECDSLPAVECPTDFGFNIVNNQGECTAASKCPAGYSFNYAKTACSLDNFQVPAACPQGTTYDTKTGKCVAVGTCPSGYSLVNLGLGSNQDNYLCVAPSSVMSAVPVCPEGASVYKDPATGQVTTCMQGIKCTTGFAPSADGKCCLPSPNTYGATCA